LKSVTFLWEIILGNGTYGADEYWTSQQRWTKGRGLSLLKRKPTGYVRVCGDCGSGRPDNPSKITFIEKLIEQRGNVGFGGNRKDIRKCPTRRRDRGNKPIKVDQQVIRGGNGCVGGKIRAKQ